MGARRSLVVFLLLILFAFVCSDECNKRITRQKFYSKETQVVRVENHFGNVLVKKHSDDAEARVLVEVNLVGTLQHAANPYIVFSDNKDQALVMVGPLAEDSSSEKLSLYSTWMLSIPLMAGLVFQRRAFAITVLMLFSIWMSVTLAQSGCPSGDVEVFMPKNSCFSVTKNQNGRSATVDVIECKVEDRPQVVACSVSGYLYSNCTEGSRGIWLSWDVMFSAATNDSLPSSDSPIVIEWSLKPINCPTCRMVKPFTAILEIHEAADIEKFQSRSRILPSNALTFTNGSVVAFLLRVDTPREGYSMTRECDAPDGSTTFTNAIPFNPGPLKTGQLSLNTTVFNAHQSVFVKMASEVCFLLRGFENGICDSLTYRASLGTTSCGNDSINFTQLSYQTIPNSNATIRTCLQHNGSLDMERYFVTIEAVDIVGLSTIVCPDVNFVVDNTQPQFIYVNMTCFTRTVSEEQLSWDIQALSGIVAIRYNISNMDLDNPQDFVPFPDPVESNQLNYNIQPLLPDHSGAVFLTLQAESRVGLTNTYNIRADMIC